MTTTARRVRSIATFAVAVALLAGTIWGEDDHFPFGPFRMYSTTTTREVTVIRFRGIAEDGTRLELRSQSFGLRPAEMQGQIARFSDVDALVAHLVEAYDNLSPEGPRLRELRLVFGRHRLSGGRPVAYAEETLGVWRRR